MTAAQDMEVMDDGGAAQVEEVLAQTPVARTGTVPAPDVGEGVLDGHPFAQLGRPEPDQSGVAEGRALTVQTIQHHLPAAPAAGRADCPGRASPVPFEKARHKTPGGCGAKP